ncbi:MAG: class I SAM-dependent methyltransferase [Leptospiraceae bacterium]|nr:class I SAM-dependent methyltransferase [Leptospiraceae bacterium]MDW7975127.1 class I SAM-dependent methyltransferase [Leptospiraceae bacterium]
MDCPFCEVPTSLLFHIKKFSEPFSIYICKNCGLQHKYPQNQSNYYTKDYYEGKAEYSYIDERRYFPFFEQVWRARLKTIKKYKPPPLRFLDVGCGFGGFVLTALRMGYDAEGIDVSEYAVEEAKKNQDLKNRIYHTDLLSFEPKKKYDVITLIEVIEHLTNPKSVFEKLSDLLNPKGLLVIQTANMDGLQAKLLKERYHYYLPGHLYYYSKKNLINFLKLYGFEDFIPFHGVDFGLLPKYKKMMGFFVSFWDYRKFLRVGLYHFLSKIAIGNFAMTSSFVLYAFKKKSFL